MWAIKVCCFLVCFGPEQHLYDSVMVKPAPQLLACTYPHLSCPVNCVTSPWSAWGVCTRNGQTCGYKYGVQTRTRDVVQAPSANGSQCLTTTETRKCKLKYRSCVGKSTLSTSSNSRDSEQERLRVMTVGIFLVKMKFSQLSFLCRSSS